MKAELHINEQHFLKFQISELKANKVIGYELEKKLDESRARLSPPLAREIPALRYGRRRIGRGAGRAWWLWV